MFSHVTKRRQSRHSLTGTVASCATHLVLGAGALYLAQGGRVSLPKPITQALTFVSIKTLPEISLSEPVVSKPAPAPRVAETPRLELPVLRSEPIPQPVVETRRAEVQPPAPQPRPRELPMSDAPPPAPAPVVVGAFANSATSSHAPATNREVQTAAFDTVTARAQEVKLTSTTAVGGFDRIGTTDPRPGSDRPVAAVVTEAGFGAASAAAPARTLAIGTVGNAGFGDTNAGTRTRTVGPKPTDQVQQTAFGHVTTAPPPARPAPRPERVDVAVEVLSKPTPAYTDEARALKLEGDVLLEVEFFASGQVRVLRIVRGLGHGLDESAARAAERIAFKPARTSSGPVDFRTTVQITFRLT